MGGQQGSMIPMKFIDDDNKIEEFLNAKKKYYQNMPTRGNVWRTEDSKRQQRQNQNVSLSMLQSKQIKAPTT